MPMRERIALTARLEDIRDRFDVNKVMSVYEPREAIAPTEDMPIIVGRRQERKLVESRWGLFPFWAKDAIHADLQGVLTKQIFDRIVKKQRCIIPGNAVCSVWEEGKETHSTRATVRNQTLFGMAGLYEERIDSNGQTYRTFTVVTTAPNRNDASNWDGMPLVLGEEHWDEWLDPSIRDKSYWENRLHTARSEDWDMTLTAERPVPMFAE
jgi:putative SOS response-associated peptidase YedK